MKLSVCWIEFSFSQVYQSALRRFVLLPHRTVPSHTIFGYNEQHFFQNMAQEVADFLKGHDNKIIDELKGKMTSAAEKMEFEKAAEYRDLLQSIATLRTKQRVMAKDLQNRDVFGYYVDKGWMCVQVLSVKENSLSET